jgi:hypothetical protein
VVVGFVLHSVFSFDLLARTDTRKELELDDKPKEGSD